MHMLSFRILTIGLVSAALVAAVQARPTDDEQMAALAKTLEDAILAKDTSVFAANFDMNAFLAESTKNVPARPEYHDDFIKGVNSSGNIFEVLAKRILDELGTEGSYHFLRLVDRDGQRRILFRLVTNSGLNYHELIMDGQGKVMDVHIAISGEKLSETIRRAYVRGALDAEKGPNNSSPELAAMDKMVAAQEAGNYAEVLKVYDTVPENARKSKILQIMRLMAAQKSNNEETYLKVLQEFRGLFPDDTSADLMSIDAFLIQKKSGDALQSLDRIEKTTGGDAYLDVLRCNIVGGEGRHAEARVFAERAVKAEPTLYPAHDAMLSVSIYLKDHDETARQLECMEKQFGLKFTKDLNNAEMFAEFKKSEAYQKWAEGR